MCSWCDLNETTFELDIVIILLSKQVSDSPAFRGSAVLGLVGVVRSIMNVPTARAACSSAVHRCWLSSSRCVTLPQILHLLAVDMSAFEYADVSCAWWHMRGVQLHCRARGLKYIHINVLKLCNRRFHCV